MTRSVSILVALALVGVVAAAAWAEHRYEPPDLGPEYRQPVTATPAARWAVWGYVDVAALIVAIALASYLALRRRSRTGLLLLALASLGYFGFYRKGCVCPIGAIQNVAQGLFGMDPSFHVPVVVIIFFLVPLVATLLFGRTFCASVCPLGAIQDVVVLRPVRVPDWAGAALGMLAWVYLAAAVLFATTDSAYIICRYDPFVAFFRMNGSWDMFVIGGSFLLIGVFVGRAYCRFLCPLGAIFRVLSRLSKFRVTITPDECIRCRLCEDACPFGAIRKPTEEKPPGGRRAGRGVLAALLVAAPLLVALGGVGGYALRGTLARMHRTVRLAELVRTVQAAGGQAPAGASQADEDMLLSYNASAVPAEQRAKELYDAEAALRERFASGSAAFGAFVALVIAAKLLGLSVRRGRTDYEPDRATCQSCGRCFEYCPRERLRHKKPAAPPSEEPA